MDHFVTSSGRKIQCISGYEKAHPAFGLKDVLPENNAPVGSWNFGIDGFIKDLYEYALMIDFLESLGLPTQWKRTLDIGGGEGTISRLLRANKRASWTSTLDIKDRSKELTTAACLKHLVKFKTACLLSGFSPKLRRFLLGEAAWRNKRLTPVFQNFGYWPPNGSVFWNFRIRALPLIDRYITGDFYDLDEKFDLITSFLALPCFEPERMFSKISKLLDEGGVFFFLSDNWWFPVNSSLIIGRFPYAAQRLSETDFVRYARQFHPERADDMITQYRYFHQGKERPTLDDYVRLADRFDLELLGTRRFSPPGMTHNRAVLPPRFLNQFQDTRLEEVLENIRQFKPDVGMADLLSNYHLAVFIKRGRRPEILSDYLNNRKSDS